jgi:gliding motility-associated-like protein
VLKILPHKNILFIAFFLFIISLHNLMALTITKNGAGICSGGSITLSADDISLVDYQWETLKSSGWTPLTSAKSSSIVLSFSDLGKYHLVAKDNLGNLITSNTLDVVALSVPPIPTISTNGKSSPICQGLDSLILTTTAQSNYLYYWVFNNVEQAIPSTLKFVAKKAGRYELLAVYDQTVSSNGCASKSTTYKLDYSSTTLAKIDSVPPFCKLTAPNITLVATPTGGKFKGKGITDAVLGTFSPTIAGLGKHKISYEVAQSGSCPSIVDEINIAISNPQASITTNTGKVQFCEGDNAVLSAPVGMKKYEWLLNSSPKGNQEKLAISVSGDYQVKITDNETCTNLSPPVRIEFFKAITVKTDLIPSVCGTEQTPVPLKGTPTNGNFTINGAFSTTFDYKKLGFGKHKVVYTLDGSLPCLKGTSEQEVIIQDTPKPNLGSDILLGKGSSVMLKGFIDADMTYSWLPTTNLDNANIANPTANPSTTTSYTLTVKTKQNCEGKATISVVVYEPVHIPTVFTPNGDLVNDKWEIESLKIYNNPEVHIFNRWGSTVFYSKGKYDAFDGTENNKPLPEGTYFYKITPIPERPDFQYKGTFTILR